MEIIDLSSDDEKSPLKVKEKATVTVENIKSQYPTMKKDLIYKNNNSEKVDVEISLNAVCGQKRAGSSGGSGNHFSAKKLKVSNESKIPKCMVIKCESLSMHSSSSSKKNRNDSSSNRMDKAQPQTSLERFSPKPSTSGTKILADGRSGSKDAETNENKGNLDGNESLVEDEEQALSNAGESSCSLDNGKSSLSTSVETMKPQLIVKSRIQLSETSEEVVLAPIKEMFQSFLDACLKRDPSSDMKTILHRLKKRFDNLEPGFAKSESFMHLIRNKRDSIANNAPDIYRQILEVKDEIKARQIKHKPLITYKSEDEDEGEGPGESAEPRSLDEKSETERSKDSKESHQLKLLEKAMRRCKRYINKCETAEVDFDDENDSHYILAEKYKHRMVVLYNKYCEITGERPDAARQYLKPKNFTVTPLPLLNNAIASFINTKVMKMNNLNHRKAENRNISFAEALIFPDYVDILNCVKKCNTEQNLQLSKRREREIAKQAFTDLGEHLQRCRKRDYYDTFSLYLEQAHEDPALEDETLASKLRENDKIGKKKLNEVFEQFVVKQNEIAENATAASNAAKEPMDERSDKSSLDTDSNSEETENESRSLGDDDLNENDKSCPSTRPRSDSPLDIEDGAKRDERAEKIKSKKTNAASSILASDADGVSLLLEKKTEKKLTDLDTSKTSSEECKENIEISVENDTQRSKVGSKPVEQTVTVPPSNIEKCVSPPILIQIQEPASKSVVTKDTVKQSSDKSDAKLASDDLSTMPTKDIEVILDNDVQKKPVLRPRSFAKPPAHWRDFQVPTSDPVANTESDRTVGGNTVLTKAVKLSSEEHEQMKSTKLNSLSPRRKTIQVTAETGNTELRKIILKIPSSFVVGRNNPKVNVQSATNNITVFNFGNQAESNPRITSVISGESNAPKMIGKSGKNKKMVATQLDRRPTNVNSNGSKTYGKDNANVRLVTSNNKQASPVEKPADRPSEGDAEALPQRQSSILSPENMSRQIRKPHILTTPVRDKNGKVVVYKMVKNAMNESKTQKSFVPKTAVTSETSRGRNQRPGWNNLSLVVADSRSKSQIPQSIRPSCRIKVPKSRISRPIKPRDGPTRSVPTYVIE